MTAILRALPLRIRQPEHGENCLLVHPHDPDTIAAAALSLVDDSELRSRLRDAGRRTAVRFCHEVEADTHLALYRRWLEARVGS